VSDFIVTDRKGSRQRQNALVEILVTSTAQAPVPCSARLKHVYYVVTAVVQHAQ